MKTIVVTPHNQDDIDKLLELLNKSNLVDDVKVEENEQPPYRKLTPEDMAFGIGRPATDKELMDYLTQPMEGEWKSLEKVVEEIGNRLDKEQQ